MHGSKPLDAPLFIRLETRYASAMIEHPIALLALLLGVLAGLFASAKTRAGKRVFDVVPLLVFAYFLPTVLSNIGLIPLDSPLYGFVKKWLLPASLVLLTLSIDLRAIEGWVRRRSRCF